MDTRAPESSSRGHWRLVELNSFHDSVSVPGPWVFCFVPPPGKCVPPRPSVRSADSNSTINARGAHPLEPLHNITPSNLFCFFSPFIVPAKPRLSPDNGCHHPNRETRIPHTHTHTRAHAHAQAQAHARVSCPPPNAHHAHAPGQPSNRDAVRAISSLIRPSHTRGA